ncbi:hypothetical protein LINPERPRIM_LOCUS1208 [Linum perenne]
MEESSSPLRTLLRHGLLQRLRPHKQIFLHVLPFSNFIEHLLCINNALPTPNRVPHFQKNQHKPDHNIRASRLKSRCRESVATVIIKSRRSGNRGGFHRNGRVHPGAETDLEEADHHHNSDQRQGSIPQRKPTHRRKTAALKLSGKETGERKGLGKV